MFYLLIVLPLYCVFICLPMSVVGSVMSNNKEGLTRFVDRSMIEWKNLIREDVKEFVAFPRAYVDLSEWLIGKKGGKR